jgi:hypothetical protein
MKSQVIEQILPLLRLPTHEQSKMRTELETHTLVELKAFLEVVSARTYQAELAEEAITQVQAEREADRIIFQLQRQKATEPARRVEEAKQLVEDKEAFTKICRQHSLSECEANFHLFRSTHSISGLAPASQAEVDQWTAEAVERRNEFLLKADTETLRTLAREEGAANRQAAVQTEADLQLAASKSRDAVMGFPLLPDTWQGQKLDSEFIRRCSVETQRLLSRRFGSAQLTARLRGLA